MPLKKNKFKTIFFFILFFSWVNNSFLFGENLKLKGKILNNFTKKGVGFATLAIKELKTKIYAKANGNYEIPFPEPGVFTIIIKAPGCKYLIKSLNISKDARKNFYLTPLKIKGNVITITGTKKLQKLSATTIKRNFFDNIPGAYGDFLQVAASLPGIVRTGGFLGHLVIRGNNHLSNRYFIDDIPILLPQHFGFLHSVISSELISEFTVYSSTFPVYFGNTIGSVINIKTKDNVKDLSGKVETSLISSNFFLENTFAKNYYDNQPDILNSKDSSNGYWITSVRAGYMGFIVPKLYKKITDEEMAFIPEYYDYQAKIKLFLDSHARHSMSLLVFGSYDTYKRNPDSKDGYSDNFQEIIQFHNQGAYYVYKPSYKFKNSVIIFNAINILEKKESDNSSFFSQTGNKFGDFDKKNISQPNVTGIKEKLNWIWWPEIANLNLVVEYNFYYYKHIIDTKRNNNIINHNYEASSNSQKIYEYKSTNQTVSGYLENRLRFDTNPELGILAITQGVRFDYLLRTKTKTISNHGVLSYEFPTRTTISGGIGEYHSFPQVNQFGRVLNLPQNSDLLPAKARHHSMGIEQVFGLYFLKLEAFLNEFENTIEIIEYYYESFSLEYLDFPSFFSTGRTNTKGFEILMRKDLKENSGGFYGWLSYTYLKSMHKTGIPQLDEEESSYDIISEQIRLEGNKYFPSSFEQKHSVKFLAGFKHGIHNLSMQFHWYTGFPFTPIIGASIVNPPYYSPQYGEKNSMRYPVSHRLDVKYSQRHFFKWGCLKWYIEVINVYNFKLFKVLVFDNKKPYIEGENPRWDQPEKIPIGLQMIPNFGVEITF